MCHAPGENIPTRSHSHKSCLNYAVCMWQCLLYAKARATRVMIRGAGLLHEQQLHTLITSMPLSKSHIMSVFTRCNVKCVLCNCVFHNLGDLLRTSKYEFQKRNLGLRECQGKCTHGRSCTFNSTDCFTETMQTYQWCFDVYLNLVEQYYLNILIKFK